jgi:hypothetical protein
MHISGINKRQLTELLLKEAKGIDAHINTLYPQIWANFRESGGLRLTHYGRKFFVEHCNIEYTTIELKTPLTSMMQVLNMDKILECPFFIVGTLQTKTNKIELFGDQVATMLALYDGDLDLYLEANKPL